MKQNVDENGNLNCTNSNKVNSLCKLTCNKGYQVEKGLSETKCTHLQTWSSELGVCKSKIVLN